MLQDELRQDYELKSEELIRGLNPDVAGIVSAFNDSYNPQIRLIFNDCFTYADELCAWLQREVGR